LLVLIKAPSPGDNEFDVERFSDYGKTRYDKPGAIRQMTFGFQTGGSTMPAKQIGYRDFVDDTRRAVFQDDRGQLVLGDDRKRLYASGSSTKAA
jgi:hypothetical protein